MGIYVNPNNANLLRDIKSQIYVDKSLFITKINKLVNTGDNFLCVSRARRFGKSMAANMLAAYYSKGCDSRQIFAQLKLGNEPDYDRYLNKLNVIKLDVNGFFSEFGPNTDIVDIFTTRIRKEMNHAFPDVEIDESDFLPTCIQKVYAATGEQFVIIIDEYDVLVRERVPEAIFQSYLRFLNAMFKNADLSPAIALAYLTGILPIVRDKIQSKLNLFQEYTMLNSLQLAEFVGFTTDEVQELCQQHSMDFVECRRWYDGYTINGMEIYSPCSVVSAMLSHEYGGYWIKTGSFESLVDFIRMDFDGIREDIKTMLGGGMVPVNTTTYLNSMNSFNVKDDAFTYLMHIGYLAYDRKQESCYIPNSEIAGEWLNAIERCDDYQRAFKLVKASKKLIESTLAEDETAVAAALTIAHEEICNNLNYNDEGIFQAVICLAFFYAKATYTIFKELTTGKGYADIVLVPYVPNVPAIIIELKRNQCTATALEQIRECRYAASLEHYHGNLLFVGVNYDESTKEHTCAIERFVK